MPLFSQNKVRSTYRGQKRGAGDPIGPAANKKRRQVSKKGLKLKSKKGLKHTATYYDNLWDQLNGAVFEVSNLPSYLDCIQYYLSVDYKKNIRVEQLPQLGEDLIKFISQITPFRVESGEMSAEHDIQLLQYFKQALDLVADPAARNLKLYSLIYQLLLLASQRILNSAPLPNHLRIIQQILTTFANKVKIGITAYDFSSLYFLQIEALNPFFADFELIDPDISYLLKVALHQQALPVQAGTVVLLQSAAACKGLCAANNLDQADRLNAVQAGLHAGDIHPLSMSIKYLPVFWQQLIYAIEIARDRDMALAKIAAIKGEDSAFYRFLLNSISEARLTQIVNLGCMDPVTSKEEIKKMRADFSEDINITPQLLRAVLCQHYYHWYYAQQANVIVCGLPVHHAVSTQPANGFCTANTLESVLKQNPNYQGCSLLQVVDPAVFPKPDKTALAAQNCYHFEMGEKVVLAKNRFGPRPLHPAMSALIKKLKDHVNDLKNRNIGIELYLSLGLDSHCEEEAFG